MIFLKNNWRQREESSRLTKADTRNSTLDPFSLRCGSCGRITKMSIPGMGAHAAFKVRDNLNDRKGTDRNEKKSQNNNFQQNQQIPSNETKYNPPAVSEKFGLAIWGMYNRFSVHNIKSHIAFDDA